VCYSPVMDPMKGRICLITGATSGIGKAAAIELARRGATLVLSCRDSQKGESTIREIREKTGVSADLLSADLSSLESVRQLARMFQAKYPALHVLINNAGLLVRKRTLSADGLEMTFAVNHLAYFLLSHLLLDMLKASGPARIVNVSSDAHFRAALDFDDLQSEKKYSPFGVYCKSKLCNVLFTYELAKRLQGTSVTANTLHPGFVATGFFRDTPGFVKTYARFFALSPEKGAKTTVFLASSGEVNNVSGKYFKRCAEARSSALSYETFLAQRLWQVSKHLAGLS